MGLFLTIVLLYLLECSYGAYGLNASVRIANANNLEIEKYPYVVYIDLLKQGDNHASTCTGVLIDLGWVLTAAHCIIDTSVVKVYAGAQDRDYSVEHRNAEVVRPHILYSDITHYNDIGLIEIFPPFTKNAKINPIKMAEKDEVPQPGTYEVLGFGVDENETVHRRLRGTSINLLDYDKCNEDHYHSTLTKNMICAGGDGKGVCKGDAGAPLVKDNKLYGVAFLSNGCNQPGVFVSIAKYRKWIQEIASI